MANTFCMKRTDNNGFIPSVEQLALGEIAINTADGIMFIKNKKGEILYSQFQPITKEMEQYSEFMKNITIEPYGELISAEIEFFKSPLIKEMLF
jgi:hypothetical protein